MNTVQTQLLNLQVFNPFISRYSGSGSGGSSAEAIAAAKVYTDQVIANVHTQQVTDESNITANTASLSGLTTTINSLQTSSTASLAQQSIDETNLNAEITRATVAETQNATDIATAVQSASDQQNANYNFWNNRVFAIETNVTALQSGGTSGSVDYSSQISAIRAAAVTDEMNIATTLNYMSSNDSYMSALNNSIADKAGEIYTLQGDLAGFSQTIGNVSAQLATLQASVLSSSSNSQSSAVTQLQHTTAALQTSVATLTASTATSISTLTASTAAVQGTLASLSTSEQSLQVAVSNLQRTSLTNTGNQQINGGLSVLGSIMEANDAEAIMSTVWFFGYNYSTNNGSGKIRVHRKGNMITLQVWAFSVIYSPPSDNSVHICAVPIDALPTWSRPSRFMSYIVSVAIDQNLQNIITTGLLTITTDGVIGIRPLGQQWLNTSGIAADLSISYLIG